MLTIIMKGSPPFQHTHTQQLSVSHFPISRPTPAEARAEQRSRPPAPAPTRTQLAIVSVCSCPGSTEESNKKEDPKWCVTLAEGEGGAGLFHCHICPHSGLVGWAAVVCMFVYLGNGVWGSIRERSFVAAVDERACPC